MSNIHTLGGSGKKKDDGDPSKNLFVGDGSAVIPRGDVEKSQVRTLTHLPR
jgi:hypothetical protein